MILKKTNIIAAGLILPIIIFLHAPAAFAETSSISSQIRNEFLSRIKSGLRDADKFMEEKGILEGHIDLRGMPEGEPLIMDVVIPPHIQIDGVVFGEVHQDTVIISLKDIVRVLEFPIEYDNTTGLYTGWLIREDNKFLLDAKRGIVEVAGKEYDLPVTTKITDDDIFVPVTSIKEWFNTRIDVDVGTQRLVFDPSTPLPATLRYQRRNKEFASRSRQPASMPRYKDDYSWFETPVADVNTQTTFRNNDTNSDGLSNFVNIRTAGEFAKGALTTNSAFNDKDGLFSARVTYLQESADPELLGDIGARRLEIGDLSPTRLPITGSSGPETGIRITNADPMVSLTLPSTRIEGYYLPGWDIELYRENSLLSFQETDENGYYAFEDVPLFTDRNYFRIVAYGPQGEVREEVINIPYDRNRLAETGSVYDISLTFQDRQFYEKNEGNDIDRDTPHVVGFYEIPIMERTALRIGGRYRQEEGEDKVYASTGISTSIRETLLNAEVAGDEKGEMKTSMSAIRQFGPHRARADLDIASDEFNPGRRTGTVNTFSNRYNIEGPLGLDIGISPRYSGSVRYDVDSNDNKSSSGFLSMNTQFKNLGVNQSVNYNNSDTSSNGTEIGGITAFTGSYGRNLLRAIAQYNFKPDTDLTGLTAAWKHRYNSQIDTQLQVDRSFDEEDLTRYSAQMNWWMDEAVITPRVSYDSEGDLEAMLSTRFSVAKEPNSGDFIMTRDSLTNYGTLSAFVYLDKDGNFQYDDGDEPIDKAHIITPQNAGGGYTNENGLAYITNFRPSLITDVYIDNASLSDPFWISAKEGHSIMPRTGDNIYMEFPIHMAGEIDGTVYKKFMDGHSEPAANISLALYNQFGELEQKTIAGPDGFYLFSLIPPGKYYLTVNKNDFKEAFGRPLPQMIEIGFDGTVLYGQNLLLYEGVPDIPVKFMSATNELDSGTTKISLNLGSYESPLMSAVIWKKLTDNFSYYLGGGTLKREEKNNSLRLDIPENSIYSGYQRCSELVRNGKFCEVEVYMAGLQ